MTSRQRMTTLGGLAHVDKGKLVALTAVSGESSRYWLGRGRRRGTAGADWTFGLTAPMATRCDSALEPSMKHTPAFEPCFYRVHRSTSKLGRVPLPGSFSPASPRPFVSQQRCFSLSFTFKSFHFSRSFRLLRSLSP
ncbi:unnamed protein product [Peniophora sp. CBMAI 1063]|nr:unnamed protein product [Peniophora sp. CBMAI 1063]